MTIRIPNQTDWTSARPPRPSGVNPPALVLGITADSEETDFASTVSTTITHTGGTGTYYRVWSLTDPYGEDRTDLLDDAAATTVAFDLDLSVGVWTLRCVVTSGTQVAYKERRITAGASGLWLRAWQIDFTAEADQATAATLSVTERIAGGSVTITRENSTNDQNGGLYIGSGRCVTTVKALSGATNRYSASSTRTGPGGWCPLDITGLSDHQRPILLIAELDAVTGMNAVNDFIGVGIENNPGFGTSASGAGVVAGQLEQAAGTRRQFRGQGLAQMAANPDTTSTIKAVVIGVWLGHQSCQLYYTTDSTLDTPDEILAAPSTNFGAVPSNTTGATTGNLMPTNAPGARRITWGAASATGVLAGPTISLKKLTVWVGR